MTRPLALTWMMGCWILERSFTSRLAKRERKRGSRNIRGKGVLKLPIQLQMLDSGEELHVKIGREGEGEQGEGVIKLPVQQVRHDKTIGNDVDDEVLDPREELHLVQALKIGINRQDK